jgi:DNA-binding transcriptional LysR family regulator
VDRFRTISLLMKIVETGSMRAAGEALGISKSVVSHEVNKLEERLGARLLYRNTRRLVPTEAGARFIARGPPCSMTGMRRNVKSPSIMPSRRACCG